MARKCSACVLHEFTWSLRATSCACSSFVRRSRSIASTTAHRLTHTHTASVHPTMPISRITYRQISAARVGRLCVCARFQRGRLSSGCEYEVLANPWRPALARTPNRCINLCSKEIGSIFPDICIFVHLQKASWFFVVVS